MAPPPPPPSRRNNDSKGAASKEENIYIPSFISKRPFYAVEEGDDTTDYLEHQRLQKKKDDAKWYDRGKTAGPAATKWRKGACENCGAMGHQKKDCLERPRKIGARWTGKDIRPDSVVQDLGQMGFAAKRDRWNGYDAKEYRHVVERYNQMEELRNQLKKEAAGKDEDGDEAEDDAGEKYAEEIDMGKHQSTATRQLRLREDTAKYLLNLDLESAKYDPKTRTMVDAGATHDKAAELFAEEGFQRASGDAAEFDKATRYAWEKQEKAGDTSQHLQANPTAGEFFRKKEKEEADRERAERWKTLQDKYGGDQSAMPAALRHVTVTESETFVEYDEAGLIKGAPKASATSKYAEDVHVNNHTSVWGSWWSNFQWGYACCHSLLKNSYCTGEEGREAWEEAEKHRFGFGLIEDAPAKGDVQDEAPLPVKPTTKKLTAEEEEEQELEEYRRNRTAANDPMANLLGRDEIVQ